MRSGEATSKEINLREHLVKNVIKILHSIIMMISHDNIYIMSLIFTSGFATTHVVVSVRHPITY